MARRRQTELWIALAVAGALFLLVAIVLIGSVGVGTITPGSSSSGSTVPTASVLSAAWFGSGGFRVRLSLENDGLEPAAFQDDSIYVVDQRGARYDVREPSRNFSLYARLNPGTKAIAVLDCSATPGADYWLVVPGQERIPLSITQE